MNVVNVGLAVAAIAALAGVALGMIARARWRVLASAAGALVAAAAAAVAAVVALAGRRGSVIELHWLVPLGGVRCELDALGAWFVLATALVAIPAAVYSIGYAAHGPHSRPVCAAWPLLVWSMTMVPVAANAVTLLACWELMALSSATLVLADHHRNPEARRAGQWYVAMTHLSLLAIAVAMFVLADATGTSSFASMRDAAGAVGSRQATVVFVCSLVGFGAKAGVVPLHVWLPRAHPEAPSHVSAVMSGAMVNLGVYGLVRVGWDLLGGGPAWWGVSLVVIGLVSAVFGILHALMASDLKRLLAYSTTENVGLMFVGLGAAGMFAAHGNRPLAAVALAACLAHVLSHGAFKGLLFLSAGSVASATGTRDLDLLGGLGRRMPVTTAAFVVGGLAMAALPPSNGFVTEWLLLQSLVHSLPSTATSVSVLMPAAVAIVALTGGLAAAAFVKAFGTGFLAMPRSAAAAEAHESPWTMRVGMIVLAGACAAIAFAPTLLAAPLQRAIAPVAGIRNGDPIETNGVYLRLAGIEAGLSPLMLSAGLLAGTMLAAAVVRGGRRRATVRGLPAWGCGRTVHTPRMEYTAASFAEPLQRVFDDVLHPEIDLVVDHRSESRHYVESIRYRALLRDAIEDRLYRPLIRAARRCGEHARSVQNGSVHRYLAYSIAITLLVLVVSQ